MPSSGQNRYDEQQVIQYLLGCASDEETAHLDELSITDDEFASRLRSAENDLVDAYVRGELEGQTLQQFKSFYLASPSRLEKVRFAEVLATLTDPSSASIQLRPTARRVWTWTFSWSIAAAALLLLMATVYLVYENRHLYEQFAQEQSRRVALEQQAQALQKQLDGYSAPVRTPEVPRGPASPIVLAFELSPQTRGVGSVATAAVPPGTNRLVFQLMLESDDFPQYRAALRDPAVNQIIWRSGGVKAVSRGAAKAVNVNFAGALLKQQNYTLELTGISPAGKEELVDSYAFRVTTK